MVSTRMKSIPSRTSTGRSSRSFSLCRGKITLFSPTRGVASTLCVTLPLDIVLRMATVLCSWQLGVRNKDVADVGARTLRLLPGTHPRSNGAQRHSALLEVLWGDAGLFEDGTKGGTRNGRPRVVRNDSATLRGRVVPDFVASFGLTVKHEASSSQSLYHLSRGEGWEPGAHGTTGTGMRNSKLSLRSASARSCSGRGSPCST